LLHSSTLRALARKYETLIEIHEALLRFDDGRARTLDRALAAEFPGALRELQTTPIEDLLQRSKALAAAAEGRGPVEDWMAWMHAYHALLRAALHVKRHGGLDDVAMQHARDAGISVDEAFAAACRRPPAGRIGDIVLRRLGRHFGVAPDLIARALFPRQRRRIE
jgi:hypothetical protein